MSSEIYTQYSDQIASLQAEALSQYQGNIGIGQRKWRLPEGWTGNPFDIEGISAPFDREELSEAYQTTITGDGTVSDSINIKIQSDYLAAQERAFRARYASPIRCSMHSANRRSGHSLPGGPINRVTDHLIDVQAAGGG